MAAGRKQQQQQGVVVSSGPSVARRMWRVLRAVLYMLRRGLPSGRKLAMDLHLLLHRGKIAGKALGDLLASHHHHDRSSSGAGGFSDSYSYYATAGGAGSSSSFSCRALDPGLAVHEPSSRGRRRREVEFSCSNTPSAADFGGLGLLVGAGKRGSSRRRNHRDEGSSYFQHYYSYDAADVARVFEMLNDDGLFGDEPATAATAATTPSPARLLWAFARSPVSRQPPRVAADSPAPSTSSSRDDGAQVDRRADEFIRRFYEQLRAQKSAASTPEYYGAAATSPYVVSSRRTPRRAIMLDA